MDWTDWLIYCDWLCEKNDQDANWLVCLLDSDHHATAGYSLSLAREWLGRLGSRSHTGKTLQRQSYSNGYIKSSSRTHRRRYFGSQSRTCRFSKIQGSISRGRQGG